jgi:N-acetylglutamate synthase-like GNAT family acetyltransferase
MGTKFIEALVDIAKASGCKYIELESVPSAVEFYEKMGFERIPKRAEFGLISMHYKIMTDEEFKETSKYKKTYLESGSFGGKTKK